MNYYDEVRILFNNVIPNRAVSKSIYLRCKAVQRYKTGHYVKDLPRAKRPKSANNVENKFNVLYLLRLVDQNIYQKSVMNICKSEKLELQKIQFVYELVDNDPGHYNEFCCIFRLSNIEPEVYF